jgi:hypothetical protein
MVVIILKIVIMDTYVEVKIMLHRTNYLPTFRYWAKLWLSSKRDVSIISSMDEASWLLEAELFFWSQQSPS